MKYATYVGRMNILGHAHFVRTQLFFFSKIVWNVPKSIFVQIFEIELFLSECNLCLIPKKKQFCLASFYLFTYHHYVIKYLLFTLNPLYVKSFVRYIPLTDPGFWSIFLWICQYSKLIDCIYNVKENTSRKKSIENRKKFFNQKQKRIGIVLVWNQYNMNNGGMWKRINKTFITSTEMCNTNINTATASTSWRIKSICANIQKKSKLKCIVDWFLALFWKILLWKRLLLVRYVSCYRL